MLLSSSDVFLRSSEGFSISKSFNKSNPWNYYADPDQENTEVKFRCYGMINYPNGDNRMFTIKGSHSFNQVFEAIRSRYNYISEIWIQYEDKNLDVITVNGQEDYEFVLRDSSSKINQGDKLLVDFAVGQWQIQDQDRSNNF